MARDKHGRQLKVGDTVVIAATVRQIFAGEVWTNVVVQPLEPMQPAGQRQTLNIHGAQCELAEPPIAAGAACDEGTWPDERSQ